VVEATNHNWNQQFEIEPTADCFQFSNQSTVYLQPKMAVKPQWSLANEASTGLTCWSQKKYFKPPRSLLNKGK